METNGSDENKLALSLLLKLLFLSIPRCKFTHSQLLFVLRTLSYFLSCRYVLA